MWQEALRLCEALKDFSYGQTVATEEETAAEAPEEVQNRGEEEPPTPAPPRKPKKNGKKRWRRLSLILIYSPYFSLWVQFRPDNLFVLLPENSYQLFRIALNFCADLITSVISAPSSGYPPSQALLSRHHVPQLYCMLFSFIKYTILQPSLCPLAKFLLTASLITDILPVADSLDFSLGCMSDYTLQSLFLKVTIYWLHTFKECWMQPNSC